MLAGLGTCVVGWQALSGRHHATGRRAGGKQRQQLLPQAGEAGRQAGRQAGPHPPGAPRPALTPATPSPATPGAHPGRWSCRCWSARGCAPPRRHTAAPALQAGDRGGGAAGCKCNVGAWCMQLQQELSWEGSCPGRGAEQSSSLPWGHVAHSPQQPTCGVHLEDIHPSVVDRRLQRLALLLLLECLPLSTQLIPRLEPVTHLRRQARGRSSSARPGRSMHACCGRLLLPLLMPPSCKAHLEARGQSLAAVHIINVAPLGVAQHLHHRAAAKPTRRRGCATAGNSIICHCPISTETALAP